MSRLVTLLAGVLLTLPAFAMQNATTVHTPVLKKVFIESAADGMPIDAVHLALSSTAIRWTDDKSTADVLLKFNREVAGTNSTTERTQIKIGIHWTYTLVASLPDGTVLYQGSAPENFVPRADHSEDGWVKHLRTTPE